MKKLLTATLALLALAAFPALSAAQNKKKAPDKPKETALAYPPADKVTLSGSNPVLPNKPCPVTAKPGLTNTTFIYPNYHYVYFQKFVAPNWIDLTPNLVTNSQGVATRTVPKNTTIRAYIFKKTPIPVKAYSDVFNCNGMPPPRSLDPQ